MSIAKSVGISNLFNTKGVAKQPTNSIYKSVNHPPK